MQMVSMLLVGTKSRFHLEPRARHDRFLDFIVGELFVRIIHGEPFHFLAIGPEDEHGRNRVNIQLLETLAEILIQKHVGERSLSDP